MLLFVGLGNIGKVYDNTRHNVGFMIVSRIAEKYNFLSEKEKKKSEIFSGCIGGEKTIIIKPQTYMNNSGIAVQNIMSFFKLDKKNIYVFHDDLDLSVGRVKYKIGGGSGGHNGIKSIDNSIGNDYNRIRVGISHPEYKDDISNYVLGKFGTEEVKKIEMVIDRIVDNIEILLKNSSLFLTKINSLN